LATAAGAAAEQNEPRKLNDFNAGVFFAPIAPKPKNESRDSL
jgi:hypothetical protein